MALHRPGTSRERTILQPKRRSTVAPQPPAPPPLVQDAELDAMRAADHARDMELHPFSDRNKRRWKMYVLASMVYFPLMTFIFTPAGLGALWFQLLVAAAYGTYVAFARPTGVPAALATLLAGTLAQVVAGVPKNHFSGLLFVLSLFLYGVAGLLVGVTEKAKHVDGE